MGGKKLQTRSIDESSKIFRCKGGGLAETWFNSWRGEDLEAAVKSKEYSQLLHLFPRMWEEKKSSRGSYQEGFKIQLEQKSEGC